MVKTVCSWFALALMPTYSDKFGGFSSPIPGASPRGITAKKERQPPRSMEPGGATAPHRSRLWGIPQANKNDLLNHPSPITFGPPGIR